MDSRILIHAPAVTLAACVFAAGFLACGRPPESAVGASDRPPMTGSDAGPNAASARTAADLPLLKDFRTRYAKLAARFPSNGHASGRFDVEVFANDSAREGHAKHTAPFPVGATFVKEHWERAPEGFKPGPIMAMEKMPPGFDAEHGDWRYVVVSPEGQVLTDGKPDGCVLCHDDASHDHVFVVGAPRP